MAKKEILDANDNTKSKARYWIAVGYPENMLPNWEKEIGERLELPYCYCIHDRDSLEKTGDEEDRKVHVHIIIAFPNTTTYSHALSVYRRLNAPGKNAFPTAFSIISIRNKYDYLIHRTQGAKNAGKYQYDVSDRKSGNNFDIGAYEQISQEEIREMRRELGALLWEKKFSNYASFYVYVCANYNKEYENVLTSYSAHFARLTKGVYQHQSQERVQRYRDGVTDDDDKKTLWNDKLFESLSKHCRRVHVFKDGTYALCNGDDCSLCDEKDVCGFVHGFDDKD